MSPGQKRKADHVDGRDGSKRQKQKKQWRVTRKNDNNATQARNIQPGDSGIWATCNKGKEGKCIGELRDLFAEYAELLYDDANGLEAADSETKAASGVENDIENDIDAELAELSRPTKTQLFTPVRLEVQCVVFFKTVAPVEPVSLVKRICEDATNEPTRKRTRFVKRLSPMTLVGRATEEGLEKVTREVLAPHFHQRPIQPRKVHDLAVNTRPTQFAIRPTLRNHNAMNREGIIKLVASLVGPGHEVNLKGYDLLIIVEVYQNICGVSVLDDSFERLKRYNVMEIFDPTETVAVAPTQTHMAQRNPEHAGTPPEPAEMNTAA